MCVFMISQYCSLMVLFFVSKVLLGIFWRETNVKVFWMRPELFMWDNHLNFYPNINYSMIEILKITKKYPKSTAKI